VPIVKVNSESRMRKVSVTTSMLMTLMFCASIAFSQVKSPPPEPSPTPPLRPLDGTLKNPDDTPLTTFEEEIRAKRELRIAEKDYQENLNRAKEIGDIGKEFKDFKDSSSLDRDCVKKIERLEKLTKKVRSEAGGDDEEITITPRPTDLTSAMKQISEASANLSKEVQNTPRRVVSA